MRPNKSPGGRAGIGRWGREILCFGGTVDGGSTSAFTRTEFAHDGDAAGIRQHSIAVLHLWYHRQGHSANHEAFLSLGCALICWQSLRRGD